jgi:hypothetical protein
MDASPSFEVRLTGAPICLAPRGGKVRLPLIASFARD